MHAPSVTGGTAAQDAWVQTAFGVNPATYKAGPATLPAPPVDPSAGIATAVGTLKAEVARLDKAGIPTVGYKEEQAKLAQGLAAAQKEADPPKRKKALAKLLATAGDLAARAKADADGQLQSVVEGTDKAVASLRDGAAKQIKLLKHGNPQEPVLQAGLAVLDGKLAAAAKEPDRLKKSKLLDAANTDAQSLFDAAAKVSGDKAAVQATYKKALKARYGFEIDNPNNSTNTHFDGVYKMLGKVPVSDVVQDRLALLTYDGVKKGATPEDGAAYGGATIDMGEYPDGDQWEYQTPESGEAAPVKLELDGFDVSTLHELGHSVDDRFGIMEAHRGKPGGGGWRGEDANSAAAAALRAFRAGPDKALPVPDAELLGLILKTLTSAVPKQKPGQPAPPDPMEPQPAGMDPGAWKVVAAFLARCYGMRSHKDPWFKQPDPLGTRVYQESYPNQWWSYDPSARAKHTVRNYQWRAPGEWFAELYAYSFHQSKAPPTGIDPAIAAYMYGGKKQAAGKGAGAPASHKA